MRAAGALAIQPTLDQLPVPGVIANSPRIFSEIKMVAANLKAETMKLMEKRSGLEAEMDVIIQRLCVPGGPGLSGNLVDSEGFPRPDIDIPTVRADRHKLSVLRNDHKDITEKIDQNIQLLHSARLTPAAAEDAKEGTSPSFSNLVLGGSSSAMDVDVVVSKPFAMVDEISEASPAAEDGLQLGDQIVKFGDVEIGDNLLQRLAAESQKNQDKAVSLVIMRQGALVNLNVTPRTWPGRGLLGCHFRIL